MSKLGSVFFDFFVASTTARSGVLLLLRRGFAALVSHNIVAGALRQTPLIEGQNVQRLWSIWENFHQVVTPSRVLLWHLGMKRRVGR